MSVEIRQGMATRTPGSLREWANTTPEEMRALEASDAIYRQEGASRQAEEPEEEVTGELIEDEEDDEVGGEPEVTTEGFDPEEIETYAFDMADELLQGGGDEELVALVEDYDPGEGTPSWVGDPELWDGAMELTSEIEEEDSPIYWQLVAHIYDRMGGDVISPEAAIESLVPTTEEETEEEP
jgi:hypothetical protein